MLPPGHLKLIPQHFQHQVAAWTQIRSDLIHEFWQLFRINNALAITDCTWALHHVPAGFLS